MGLTRKKKEQGDSKKEDKDTILHYFVPSKRSSVEGRQEWGITTFRSEGLHHAVDRQIRVGNNVIDDEESNHR